ncbi:hypothetical protein GGS20DRAFT_407436 [Poronia punctata]|nr:hypothetical protein GGS20DRAFT_407436 [Poronia punctata]
MTPSTGSFDSFSHFGNQGSINESWQYHPAGFSQAASNGSFHFGFFNESAFLTVKSSRQSTIILSTFNIISAAATAAGVLYDNYTSAERSSPKTNSQFGHVSRDGPSRKAKHCYSVNILTCVRDPDVYPFILSLGIVAQGVVFAVSQAQGMDGLFRDGCALISQFVWPAVFIVPYIQVVFAVEATLRALKMSHSSPRRKWAIAICLTLIIVALLATGLVTFFIRPANVCFASLFWFVVQWAEGGFTLLVGVVVILTGCALIIYSTLGKYPMIEEGRRAGGVRMVYYIILGIIPNALIIPFFGYASFSNPLLGHSRLGPTLSMVATVAANVTGLMTGGLYLSLRSGTISSNDSKKLGDPGRQLAKFEREMPRTDDESFDNNPTRSIIGPRWPHETDSQERWVDRDDFLHKRPEGATSISPDGMAPLRPTGISQYNTPVLRPDPATPPTFKVAGRKPSTSYGLFPTRITNRTSKASSTCTHHFPNTNTSNECYGLLRPPPPFQPAGFRHRRDISIASSATVQIGLRLSNVGDARPMQGGTIGATEKTCALGCPKNPEVLDSNTTRPSPSIASRRISTSPSPHRLIGLDTSMKTLPPVPTDTRAEVDETLILNPTIYDRNSPTNGKMPSPKGVGFNVPSRMNTTPVGVVEAPASMSPGRGIYAGADNNATWI